MPQPERVESSRRGPAQVADARVAGLRRAAHARTIKAEQAADGAIRELLKRGAPINFTAVARVAGVTSALLHRHSELSPRIHHLRETQREGTAPPDVNARAAESAVIAALRRKLKEEEATHAHSVQELRRRIRELEAQVAVLYGRLG